MLKTMNERARVDSIELCSRFVRKSSQNACQTSIRAAFQHQELATGQLHLVTESSGRIYGKMNKILVKSRITICIRRSYTRLKRSHSLNK